MVREKTWRSLLKSFSWRITATITTVTISWLITGKMDMALTIGGSEFLIKLGIHFMHERAWARLKFGFVHEKEPEYQI